MTTAFYVTVTMVLGVAMLQISYCMAARAINKRAVVRLFSECTCLNDKCGRLQLQKQVMKHKHHTFIPQCIGSIIVMKAIQVICALWFG